MNDSSDDGLVASGWDAEQVRASVFLHMVEGVALHEVIVGADGQAVNYRLLDVNPAYLRSLGLRRENVVGKLATEAYSTSTAPFLREYAEVSLAGVPRALSVYFAPMKKYFDISVAPAGPWRFLTIFTDVTERKQGELALAERNVQLDGFFNLTVSMFCIADADGRFLRLNPAWLACLGWTLADLVGQKYIDLVHPDDRAAAMQAEAQLREGKAVVGMVNRYRAKDGSYRWIEWRSAAGNNGQIYAAARDVTHERAVLEALRQSEARFRALAENSVDLIFTLDPALRATYVSPAVTRQWGIQPEAAIGQPLEAFFTAESAARFHERLLSRLSTNAGTGAAEDVMEPELFEVRHAGGELVPTELVVRVLRGSDGGVSGCLGVARDVSERIQREEKQRQLETKVQEAQRLESLGVFAGGIAHDFNNLLTAILGNSSLALGELEPDSPVREVIEDIELASLRAAELCRQLLAYAGKGRLVVEEISLNEVIREMTHLLSVSISKRVTLRVTLGEDAPLVRADAAQLRQIVMNLVTNAGEAVVDGHGTVELRTGREECTEAYLQATRTGDALPPGIYSYVEVADNGCGMDPATLSRIFEPFYGTKFAGRGLGLSAVLGIVRGHRGAIRMDSEEGRGTVVKVLLPAAVATALPPPPSASERKPGWGKVLVVDDELGVRTVARRMLEREGFEVVEAEDGEEALAVFAELHGQLRCVVLDMTMPRLDGEACFRGLVRLKSDVCVILCSGFSESDVVNRFGAECPTGFLQKPYTRQELLRAVGKALAKPRSG